MGDALYTAAESIDRWAEMNGETEKAVRVAVVGRTSLLHANQSRWDHLPAGVQLTLITPPYVSHPLGHLVAEPSLCWPHAVVPAFLTTRQSGFGFSPSSLWRALRRAEPDLVHVEEEPSSIALMQSLILSRIHGSRLSFFTWENLALPYPLPFGLIRRFALRCADGAIAGTEDAANVLRAAGFRHPVAIIPQLGADPAHFAKRPAEELRRNLALGSFTVAYVGRLVREKGLLVLFEALAELGGDWQCLIVGAGPLQPELEQLAAGRGFAERIRWVAAVPHCRVADYLNAADVLVLPSQTTSRWKEQFGHVLIEAMACGVPVIGSSCGAIPAVIADAGLISREGDALALKNEIGRLRDDPSVRATLAQKGRERVLQQFTNERIATCTAAFWSGLVQCA